MRPQRGGTSLGVLLLVVVSGESVSVDLRALAWMNKPRGSIDGFGAVIVFSGGKKKVCWGWLRWVVCLDEFVLFSGGWLVLSADVQAILYIERLKISSM